MNGDRTTEDTAERSFPEAIAAEARRWVLSRFSPNWSAEDEAAFERWLAEDPRHRAAYSREEIVWLGIGQLSHLRSHVHIEDLSRFAITESAAPAGPTARRGWRPVPPLSVRMGGGLAAAATLLVVAIVSILLFGRASAPENFATELATVEEIALPDGSTVTLGALSAISVRFSEEKRQVKLLTGDAFFDVQADVDRPFLVTAGNTVVRVLGTKFEVRQGAEHVAVLVAEGTVEAIIHDERDAVDELAGTISRLEANHLLVANRDGSIQRLHEIPRTALAPWRDGRLLYEDAPLSEVVFDVKRYIGGEIRLADEELNRMRVTGSFGVDRLTEMLKHLERVLPVDVERRDDGLIVIERRQAEAVSAPRPPAE